MSFDCGWRLNRRTFDTAELREVVEAVAREYDGVRVEWDEGSANRLPCHLWLPAKLVRSRQNFFDRMDDGEVSEADGPLPTELVFSFDDAGPEPFVLTRYEAEQGETLLDASIIGDPSVGPGAIGVGSGVFSLSRRRWQVEPMEAQEGWFRALHVIDGGKEVWIGSEEGVVSRRVRNGEWTSFPPVEGGIELIHVVSPTRIYLGLEMGGLLEFDGTRVVRQWQWPGQWPDMVARKLVSTADGLYLHLGQTLHRLEGNEWKPLDLGEQFTVCAIAVDDRHRLWVADWHRVYVMEQGRLQRKPILCEGTHQLAVPRANDVWALSFDGEWVHWNGVTQTRGKYEYDGRGILQAMRADARGRVWICREDEMVELRPSRSVLLWIRSNRDANRVAWSVLSELCARIATRLDGYVLES